MAARAEDAPGAGAAPSAGSISLAWDPSADPKVAGYMVHYGTEPGKYTHRLKVQGRLNAKAVVEGLEPGKFYYFAVSAFDAKGRESALSAEATNDPEAAKRARARPKIAPSRRLPAGGEGKIPPRRPRLGAPPEQKPQRQKPQPQPWFPHRPSEYI